ncbi:MAG: hydrogenase 3 maturation endopeptidase HyCI [Anaerolineaceae bacterium]|nr:hydrogenase 3 maturation endopeptidase HyCI [Anaerolineaceae bacterium]
MSNSSWTRQLQQNLKTIKRDNQPGRVVILGIGNEFNGDDAVGPWVLETLKGQLPFFESLLLINGSNAPENFTSPIRKFNPDLVIMIDAADMQQPVGSIDWVDWQHADGFSASTHTLPPHVLGKFLLHELKTNIAVIGVQIEQVEFDTPMHPLVQKAGNELIRALSDTFIEYFN